MKAIAHFPSLGGDPFGLASEAALHWCRQLSLQPFFLHSEKIAQLSKFFPGIKRYGAQRFPSTAWRTTAEQETHYAKST